MYAYEANAKLHCTNSDSTDPSITIYETDEGQFTALPYTFGQFSITADENNQSPPAVTKFATGTWTLGTRPDSASLDSTGNLRVEAKASADGLYFGRVYDEDDDSISPTTIDVGLIGGEAYGATVSVSIAVDGNDELEGDVGAGFAFSSDILGDEATDEITVESGELCIDDWGWYEPETISEVFGYGTQVNTFRGSKNAVTRAKGTVSLQVKCKDDIPGDGIGRNEAWATGGINSSFITFGLEYPTYESGEFQQNPNW